MNLGELIVELSLDSTQFAQELDNAKKRATEAAKAMENIFSKGFEIGIDDSALHDLNKHLDIKVKHLNEVNRYFKNNPVTVHVDDDQLTELNKSLEKLTRKKHVIEIEQRVKNIVEEDDLENTVKKSVEKGVKDGVKEGVKDGFKEVDKFIEDVIKDAVENGVKSAKSSGGSSSSSGTGIEDIIKEIKTGFTDAKDGADRELVSRAMEIVLKPGQDLFTGFFEGFSNVFGTEISKGFVQTLGKTMNLNLSKAGEGLGLAFSRVMGVNVDKYKKESEKAQKVNQQQTERITKQELEKAVYSGVYNANLNSKIVQNAVAVGVKNSSSVQSQAEAAGKVLLTPLVQKLSPLPDLKPLKKNNNRELELIESNLPKETPQALRASLQSAVKASDQVYDHFDKIKLASESYNNKESQSNTKSIAEMVEQSKKLRAAHSKYVEMMRNLIHHFIDLGEYDTVLKLGKDFGQTSKDAKGIVSDLKSQAKAAGATAGDINVIGQAVSPLTRGEKSILKELTKISTTRYGSKNAKMLNELPKVGQDVLNGLYNGLEGVEGVGDKTANNFIKAFKKALGINSPSLLMIEMGLMIASGLFLGIQKGNSRVAEGARKIVDTLTNTLKPVKEIADPVLGAAGAIPPLSSFGTYGSAAINVTDTGLKMLSKIGERHQANPDETLFQSVGGSVKDFVTSIKSDKTLTTPREAFDHAINITKAGALGLGANSSVITSIDAAQAGATALLRNSAVMKAIVQSHVQARAKVEANSSLNYLATFKAVLIDNLQGLKLSKGEVLKALGSAMKVVPTGIGTAANSNFGIGGEVFSNAPDALVPVLDVYRKVKREKSQGKSTKEAVASGLTDVGVPSQMANVFGSAADKFSPQLKTFVTAGRNINEGLSKGILNTTALVTTAIEVTGNAVQKQIKRNLQDGISQEMPLLMPAIGQRVVDGLSIGLQSVKNTGRQTAEQFTQGLKQALGINSPSRIAIAIGTFIGQGLMLGLSKTLKVGELGKTLIKQLIDVLSLGLSGSAGISSALAGILSNTNIGSMLGKFQNLPGIIIGFLTNGISGLKNKIPTSLVMGLFTGFIGKFSSLSGISIKIIDSLIQGFTANKNKLSAIPAILSSYLEPLKTIFNDFINPLKGDKALPLGEFLRKGINNAFIGINKKFAPNASLSGGVSRLLFDFFPSLRKPESGKDFMKSMLPLVGTFMGGRGKVIGDWLIDILTSNKLIKPGFINNLIKSISGINLGTTGSGWIGRGADFVLKRPGLMNTMTRILSASMGLSGISRLIPLSFIRTTPLIKFMTQLTGGLEGFGGTEESKRRGTVREVVEKQIGFNVASTGLKAGANTQDLVQQVLTTLFDSLTKESKTSPLMSSIIENIRKPIVDSIAKSDFLSGLGQTSIGSRIFNVIGAYASKDVKTAVDSASRLIKLGLKTLKIDKILLGLGIRVDMQQIQKVMTAVLLGVSAFHRGFTQEGLNIGNAIAKGFKEAKNNITNAVGDIQRGIDKELGREDPQKIWQQIVTKWKQGVVSRQTFDDFWSAVGSKFKRTALKSVDPENRDDIAQNALSFMASIAAVFAPITTFASVLIPLVAPLLPLFGAIGGAIFMVRRGLQGMIQEMLQIEPMQRKLDFLGGSKATGAKEMQYGIDASKRLGVPAKAAINAYSSMAVAARGTKLEGDGVRELFEGIGASMSVLGISGQDAELVFMAYTQMLAKGKISMEELRQQLGEKFPPAMQIFAKSIGKSVPEMIDLASKGALLSEEVLPKVAKQLNLEYGGATSGVHGLSIALSRLGTIGFEMSVKLTNAYSGLFAGIVNIFTSMADVVNNNLDNILMFINSFIIGTAAVLGVGLMTIFKMTSVGSHIANVGMFLGTGIGAAMTALGPHFLGIIADIADDWFGAQNTIMENMYNGVSNMIIALVTLVDNTKRYFSGAGLFDVILGDTSEGFSLIKLGVNSMSHLFKNLFGFLKPGMVEMAALVLMFQQLQTLTKYFIGPTFKGFFMDGMYQLGRNFVGMISNAFSPKGIGSLFTNLNDVTEKSKAPDYKPENVSIGQEFLTGIGNSGKAVFNNLKNNVNVALNAFDKFKNFLISPFQMAMNLTWKGLTTIGTTMKLLVTGGITLKQAFINIGQGLKTVGAGIFSVFTNIGNFFLNTVIPNILAGRTAIDNLRVAATNAIRPVTAIFSGDANIRRAALKDWGKFLTLPLSQIGLTLQKLGALALEVGLALAVMFFARSDFSNPMETAINKASKSINGSLLSIENSFTKINKTMKKSGEEAATTGNKIKSLADSIPSKGLQLDIMYVLGMKDTGYTTDDFSKKINKALAGELDPKDLNFFEWWQYDEVKKERAYGSFDYKPELNKKQTETIKKYPELQSLIRETDAFLPKGVGDVINSIGLIDENVGTFKTKLTDLGLLNQVKYAERMKQTVSKIAEIDQKRLTLSLEYNKIASENPDSEKNIKRRGEITKELQKLNSERKKQSKPIDEHMSYVSSMQKELTELKKLDLSDYSLEIQKLFRNRIQELENLVNSANKVIKQTIPEDVFQSIFMATTGALKRFELVFERFGKSIESASAKRQHLIYSNVNTPGDIDFASKQSAIIEAEDRLVGALAQYQVQQKAFTLLSLVPESQQNDATKNELEQTRKNKISAEVEVNNAKGNLAKSRYDLSRSIIEQNRQIEEFIRNAEKEVLGVKNEFEKASLSLKMMEMKTRVSESLIGVVDDGVVSFINSIVSVFDEINNTVKQQMDADARITELGFRKQEIELENQRFRESLPSKDMMDLLVKTRGDIKQVTDAFADENKKFDDISKGIIKQGQNIANGVGNANIEVQKLNAGLKNVLGFTDSIKLSTEDFKTNLEQARKAVQDMDKLFESLRQRTSTDNSGKPVADSMQGANKNSAQLAQNVNNLTSPLNGVVTAVFKMRDAFRDSSSYTAQINANLSGINTNKRNNNDIPGNTPLPQASGIQQNQYAINYGAGDLLASVGVSDIPLGLSPQLLAQTSGNRMQPVENLLNFIGQLLKGKTIEERLEEYRIKDRYSSGKSETLINNALRMLPIIVEKDPALGKKLLGDDYGELTDRDKILRQLNVIGSASRSDLNIIASIPHVFSAQDKLEQLRLQPRSQETNNKIIELIEFINHAYLHINNATEVIRQMGEMDGNLFTEIYRNPPELNSLNDPELEKLRKLALLRIQDQGNSNLIQQAIERVTGLTRPGRGAYLEFYELQRHAELGTLGDVLKLDLDQPALPSISSIIPNPSDGNSTIPNPPTSLPKIPAKVDSIVLPSSEPQQPGIDTSKVPKVETAEIQRRQITDNQIETTRINSEAAIEQLRQKINEFKTNAIRQRAELEVSQANPGGVSENARSGLDKINQLLRKYIPDPGAEIDYDYKQNLAEINRGVIQAKQQVESSKRSLAALRENLSEIPNDVNILRTKVNESSIPQEQKSTLLRLINEAETEVTQIMQDRIAQAEQDLNKLEEGYNNLLANKKKLETGATTIRNNARTKQDAESIKIQLNRDIAANQSQIERLRVAPGYDTDRERQAKVIDLEYQNALKKAEQDKLDAQVKLLEEFRANPKDPRVNDPKATGKIDLIYQRALQSASIKKQTDLFNLIPAEARDLARNRLLASITQPNQYRDGLLDIEQFRQDKTKEINASPFFALREQKDKSGQSTEEAIRQMEEFNKALADLTTEVKRRETDLNAKENDRVLNLLNEAKIARLEANKNMHGEPFTNNAEIRRLKEEEARRRYDETVRNIPGLREGATPEEKARRQNELDAARLRYENEMENIRRSYENLGSALKNAGISAGLQTLKDGLVDVVMNDLIIGFDGATGKTRDLSNELRGFERVIYNVSKAVLNAMTKILVDAAVNKLFGKDGLLDIGKIFGAAKGGIVPNYAEGGSVGEIGKAMQRERSQNGGKQPVLAVLTPGERVLTVSQNKRFEALQLERFLQPSAVMPEEIAYRKINNYAFGGVVGMNPVPMGSYAQGQSDNSTTINIPVTVENNGNSNDSQLDANSLQNVVRSAVLTEIQRQQRQGGILRR